MSHEPRLVEVRKNILKQNDLVAREPRQRFADAGVFVASLVSSPGAGKTTLLEKTLTLLHPRFRVAGLVGDLATENDAARLARSQAPVRQITRPGMRALGISAKTGAGMTEYLALLEASLLAARGAAVTGAS